MFIYIMRLIGVQYKGQLYGGSVQVIRDLLQLQSIYSLSTSSPLFTYCTQSYSITGH